MKWVEIDGYHINTETIKSFYWKDGYLNLMFIDSGWLDWADDNKSLYNKLCAILGVIPTEVKENA